MIAPRSLFLGILASPHSIKISAKREEEGKIIWSLLSFRMTDQPSHNEDNFIPETITIINCGLNAPLMLISILGNALVLAAIIRTPSIRSTPHMIMLCSLAVSDFLVGLIAQPLFIAKELTKDPLLNSLVVTVAFSVCGVSLLTMTTLSVDRFLALHYHMRYATLVTQSRVKYTLIITWSLSFLASGLFFWDNRVHSFVFGICTIILVIISTFSHIRIYLIVRKHHSLIHIQHRAVQSSNTGNNLNVARLRRSALNIFLFYIVLIICYFPIYVILTVFATSGKDWQTEWNFAHTVVFMNSSINPLLFCWRLRELRTAVIKSTRQMLCQQGEES